MRARLILVAIALGIVGIVGLYIYFWGEGEVHVLVSPEEKLVAEVDGKPIKPKTEHGRHLRFDLPRGTHTLTLRRAGAPPREEKIDIKSGFAKWVMPVSDEQCFARLDVSDAMYGDASKKSMPRLVKRFSGKEPFQVASSTYLTEDELPNTKKKRQQLYLLVEFDCGGWDLSHRDLLTEIWE